MTSTVPPASSRRSSFSASWRPSSPSYSGTGHGRLRPRPRAAHHGQKASSSLGHDHLLSGRGALVAHGRVPGGKTKVTLQVKVPGGWQTLATTSSKKGKFARTGTLDWYGKHKVRVFTPGRHPSSGART